MAITELQKLPSNLNILKASRALFKTAKRSRSPRLLITYLLAIVIPIILFIMDVESRAAFRPILGGLAALFALGAYFMQNNEKAYIKDAAEIQDLFDTNVYEIEWNKILLGDKPNVATIHEVGKRHEGNVDEEWHGDLSRIPKIFDALVAQHNTLQYDVTLRSWYLKRIQKILIGLVCLQGVFALCCHVTLEDALLAIFLPSLSAYLQGLKECKEHQDNIIGRKTAQKKIDQYIEQALTKGQEPTKEKVRQFQDIIFILRKCPAVVPDWAYDRVKERLGDNNRISIDHYATLINNYKSM